MKDPETNTETSLYLESSCIQTLYVHDDQVGMYCRMPFVDNPLDNLVDLHVEGSKPLNARVELMMIPVYHKIRIGFDSIYKIIYTLNEHCFKEPYLKEKFVFDIYVTTVCEMKENLLRYAQKELDDNERIALLTSSLPRYIWVVDVRIKYKDDLIKPINPNFSFYFDATDLQNGDFFIHALHTDENSYELVRNAICVAANDEYDFPELIPSYKQIAYYYQNESEINKETGLPRIICTKEAKKIYDALQNFLREVDEKPT